MEVISYEDYNGTIEKDPVTTYFFGQILNIDKLVTYEGKTRDKAIEYFHNTVDAYIDGKITIAADLAKYEKLYEYSFRLYDHEIKRFRHLTDKATKYLAAYSLMFLIFGFFIKWLLETPDKRIIYFEILFSISIIFYIIAWFLSFYVLSLEKMAIVQLSNEFISKYSDIELIDFYSISITELKASLENNSIVSDLKSKYLSYSYNFFIISAFFLLLTIVYIALVFLK